MQQLERGTVFNDRYEIQARIGVGGMAVVYRARDRRTGFPVAVKILSSGFLARNPREAERNLRRFKREAEILRILGDSPHVVGLVESGCSPDGDWFIAMELLEGEQLRYYIGRDRQLMGLPTFLHFAVHLAEGLSGIHARNVLHRDLAPDNVVVTRDEKGLLLPRFLDFGIGRSMGDELDQVTQMVTIMGKPQYFSPEQARGLEQTAKSDVYSLGVMLYEMATGRVPIPVNGIPDFRRIQRDPPPALASQPGGSRLPPELQQVIMACLEKEPAERPGLDRVLEVLRSCRDRLTSGELALAEDKPAAGDRTTPLPRPDADLEPGSRIGRYEVKSTLGRGGMGAVYLAWDPVLHRDVAIKVATRVEEEEAKKAILREARASSALRSANIVTIYDAGTDGGVPYIAMEYVAGRTLAEIVREKGPLGKAELRRVGGAVVAGLRHAHERSQPVVHRDLKPANILVGRGTVKITDFGIAKVAGGLGAPGQKESQTQGMAEGTAAVISPEQATGKKVDHRSDIYSLGCVLYTMSTGRPPFSGNPIAVVYQHCTAQPAPPSRLNPDLPPGLDRIILKCLAKEPTGRYASAKEVEDDLEKLFAPVTAVVPSRRRRILAWSAASLLAAGATVAGLLLGGGSGGPVSPEFQLVRVGRTAYAADRDTYFTNGDTLHLEGRTAPGNTLQVSVAPGGREPMEPQYVPAREDGGLSASFRLPVEQLEDQGTGRFQVSVKVRGADAAITQTFTVVYDAVRPEILVRDRSGSWGPCTGSAIRTLLLEDVALRLRDTGAGLHAEEGVVEALTVELDEESDTWSSGALRVERTSPDTLAIHGRDRAGNAVQQQVGLLVSSPQVTLPGEPVLCRGRSARIRVSARAGGMDLTAEPLRRLAVRLADGEGPPVILHEVPGGAYEGELELPPPREPGVRTFEVEVLFAGRPVASAAGPLRVVQDTLPPLITLLHHTAESVVEHRSDAVQVPLLRIQDRGDLKDLLQVSVDDHGRSLGPDARLEVRFNVPEGGGESGSHPLAGEGPMPFPASLPPDAAAFRCVLAARDAAGNRAELPFDVEVVGARVVPLPGPETAVRGGRILIRRTRLPELRFRASGLAPGRRLYAALAGGGSGRHELQEEDDAWVLRADRHLLPGEPCRISILDGTSEVPYATFTLAADTEDPTVEGLVGGRPAAPGSTWRLGHLPEVVLRVRDDLEVDPRMEEQLRVEGALEHEVRPRRDGGVDIHLRPPEGPTPRGTHRVELTARDLAGHELPPWTVTIETAPPEVVLETLDDEPLEQRNRYADRRYFTRKPELRLGLRNLGGRGRFRVVAKVRPEDGDARRVTLTTLVGDRQEQVRLPLECERGVLELLRTELLDGQPAPGQVQEVFEVLQFAVDAEAPTWQVRHAGTAVDAETLKRHGLRVGELSALQLVVADAGGLPPDPLEAGPDDDLERISSLPTSVTYRFRARDGFKVLPVDTEAVDLAGNRSAVAFTLRKLLDAPELLTLQPSGGSPSPPSQEPLATAASSLKPVVGAARDLAGVVVEVRPEGSGPRRVTLERAPGGDYTGSLDLAEEGLVELAFLARGPQGLRAEPFAVQEVLVDRTGPALSFHTGEGPAPAAGLTWKSGQEILVLAEDPTGVGELTAGLEAAGGNTRSLTVRGPEAGRYRLLMPAELDPGSYRLEAQAVDGLGNASPAVGLSLEVPGPSLDLDALARRTGITWAHVTRNPTDPGSEVLFHLSRTEVTVGQFRRFYRAFKEQGSDMFREMPDLPYVRRSRIPRDVESCMRRCQDKSDDMPVHHVTFTAASAYAWWAGGRLPATEEWRQAAGLLAGAREWPPYLDDGRFKESDSFLKLQQGRWSNFESDGPLPVTELDGRSPYELVGIAGNLAEWVLDERTGRGTLGGSFKYSVESAKAGGRLDRPPCSESRRNLGHVGFRVLVDPEPPR